MRVSFGVLNIDVALQISNKILFEEFFGDALRISREENSTKST